MVCDFINDRRPIGADAGSFKLGLIGAETASVICMLGHIFVFLYRLANRLQLESNVN